MVDDKLSRDEARRSANFEAIKSGVEADVGNEIVLEADRPMVSQSERVERVADDMRRTAVDEVVDTRREVEQGRVAARISQFVDYAFLLLYGLLTIRLLLELF